VVQPTAPLLATMLCGAWLAWPWFAFNSIAMGSPTRRKELVLCGVAVAGTAVLAAIAIALMRAGVITSRTELRLALLGIATWKLSMAYYVCIVQSRTFHVYEYYGGTVRSSMAVLFAGFWIRPFIVDLTDDPFWLIIITGGASA
jgi:hypothetical protein